MNILVHPSERETRAELMETDMNIDIETLRKLREQQASMVRFYAKGDDKRAQNAAMAAAGLPPIHNEASLQWDLNQGAQYRRNVEVLDAVLAHLSEIQVAA